MIYSVQLRHQTARLYGGRFPRAPRPWRKKSCWSKRWQPPLATASSKPGLRCFGGRRHRTEENPPGADRLPVVQPHAPAFAAAVAAAAGAIAAVEFPVSPPSIHDRTGGQQLV